MKIEKINLYTPQKTQNKLQKQDKTHPEKAPTLAYNPISYKDFHINFTQRLFRTPENFYAQPFNKAGMPQTMKNYLYDDFDDRQKMPPAQMLRLVFSDIKETKSLEQVKKLFPDEPLFANINDQPNRQARNGVIAEIELMKEEGKTLFKNGQDNLGLYILKKIYTESKTLKEINTDFQKDISVHYKGISPIDYYTLSAYGIKYPNNSFWKSLTATREEFPYEYKPRKPLTPRHIQNTSSTHSTPAKNVIEKKKFDNVKEWEINKLSDALIKGYGSKNKTEKQLKKGNIQDKEALNFVAKYMGEINSVVLEKLHISPDMKDYFENYDDLTKTQQEKFETYMRRSDMNELRSKVMTSTIRLFFDVYGADGNNEDFQELLDYAHNIKPNRVAQAQEHNRLQQEYERELGIFTEPDKVEETSEAATQVIDIDDDDEMDKLAKFQKLLDDAKRDYDVDLYRFDTAQGEVYIVSKLTEALQEYLETETKFMPKQYANKFIKFMLSNPNVTDSYTLTTLLEGKGVTLPQDERLMPKDEAHKTTIELYSDFQNSVDSTESRAAMQAITDILIFMSRNQISPKIFIKSIFEYINIFKSIPDLYKKLDRSNINKLYNEYRRPLSTSENSKATIAIMDLLRRYNPQETIINTNGIFKDFPDIFYSLKVLTQDSRKKQSIKNIVAKYLDKYGGTARFFLAKNIPENLKMAKLEQFLISLTVDNPNAIYSLASPNKQGANYIKNHR